MRRNNGPRSTGFLMAVAIIAAMIIEVNIERTKAILGPEGVDLSTQEKLLGLLRILISLVGIAGAGYASLRFVYPALRQEEVGAIEPGAAPAAVDAAPRPRPR